MNLLPVACFTLEFVVGTGAWI